MKKEKCMAAAALVLGMIGFGGLTALAASGIKEISTVELEDVSYNSRVYTYAIEKRYETTDPEQKITFEESVDGLKLDKVDYKMIEEVSGTKTLEKTRDYKNLPEKDESEIKESIEWNGNTYELKDVTWSEEPNVEHVSYSRDYGYSVSEPEHPDTYEYTYTSPVTKENNTVVLPFTRMERGGYGWADGFTATVTFHNLDGVYFTLGDHEFAYNGDRLSFTDSDYTELVKMLGYDTTKYRLYSASWSGKPYTDKYGEKCRDATVTGQQYAASYKAVYEDDVENGYIYTAHATYTCEVEAPAEEAPPVYVMQATGYYERTGSISIGTWLALTAVMLLILFLVFFIIFKRKKEKPVQAEEKEVRIDKQFIEQKQFTFDEEK